MALNLTPPKAAPRKSAAPSSSARVGAITDQKSAERSEGLNGYLGSATALLMLFRQYADAQAMSMHGPKVVSEVVSLATRYEKLAGAIDKAIAASPFAGLIMAVMPLGMQLAVNHGLIQNPAALAGMGIQSKEALEAEGRQAQQRMMLQALQAQKKYAEEKAAFEAELAELAQSPNGTMAQ